MNLSVILMALLCLTSTPTFSKSKSTLSQLLSNYSTNEFTPYTSTGTISNPNEQTRFNYEMTFSKHVEGLSIFVSTPLTSSSLQLSPSFKVLESSFYVNNEELEEKVGYSSRFAKRNNVDAVVFNYFKDKKNIKTKDVYYNDNTIDSFSILPILQVISNHPVDLFTAEFSVQHIGIKVPVVIYKKKTDRILSFFDKYTLTTDQEAYFRSFRQDVFVYTLKVTGWQGFIYNHRHFYVYSAMPPYNYIGHWGGPNEMNLISWANLN